ncbi:selenium metabolism-associated LysR family transcriptional regulator [Paradesulfitobacterium ferrireducens]|uniref:selenium metabolism-associated LysR family transcriptional regulator n=1 Tax=Paradesulfitobacterium ferrireducens TaxID=2816476 RepID=UPI001A8CF308|nr:selenium metabolism-associated LysR family transcriptional regulator [Paradesulfitobacterium ferrireducens]
MLDLMRLFVHVVEEQSFTAVARKLGVSQPAISNQMRVLEEKTGSRLLIRRGKGFILTPQGESVYRHALRLLAEWDDLERDLDALAGEVSGRVHIGASHIPGEYLLPLKLAQFQQQFPKVYFKITIGDSREIAEKLLQRELDFAIVGSVFDTEKLKSELWLNDELKLVISSDHPLAALNKVHLHDLKGFPMIIREQGSGHRRALETALTQHGLSLDDLAVSLEAGSTETVKNAVRSGFGYSFLSQSALEPYGKEGLKVLQVENVSIKRGFYLLTLRDQRLTVAGAACYAFLNRLTKDKV